MQNALRMITIDGKNYTEKPISELKFGNYCRFCAVSGFAGFGGTPCCNRDDFDCHADSREDGVDVVFILVEGEGRDEKAN